MLTYSRHMTYILYMIMIVHRMNRETLYTYYHFWD